jgi:hypothetical protein
MPSGAEDHGRKSAVENPQMSLFYWMPLDAAAILMTICGPPAHCDSEGNEGVSIPLKLGCCHAFRTSCSAGLT